MLIVHITILFSCHHYSLLLLNVCTYFWLMLCGFPSSTHIYHGLAVQTTIRRGESNSYVVYMTIRMHELCTSQNTHNPLRCTKNTATVNSRLLVMYTQDHWGVTVAAYLPVHYCMAPDSLLVAHAPQVENLRCCDHETQSHSSLSYKMQANSTTG